MGGDHCGKGRPGNVRGVEWDDEELEDEPSAPLLPPDDRLWRHPSEVAASAPVARRSLAEEPPPRMTTVVVLTSCISVLLTLGVVAVARPFREGGRPAATRTPSGGIETVADVADLTARLRPAITQVVARTAGGAEAWGSGVIFRDDGMMLTTHRLVDGADTFRVLLDDGRSVVARLVGADRDTDIAVIDLDGSGFQPAELAEGRGEVQVGQPAITIGTPERGRTSGPLVRTTVVSAMGQEAAVDGRRFVDMLRTDTAMEDGCAGGAVVDRHGRVIAIAATNIPTANGAIGLATPIDVARSVAAQLMADGRVRRSWIGIEGATVADGVLVESVLPGSPAAVAGVADGDVLRALGDEPVRSMSDLVVRLRETAPGTTAVVAVDRGGERRRLTITLGERPA